MRTLQAAGPVKLTRTLFATSGGFAVLGAITLALWLGPTLDDTRMVQSAYMTCVLLSASALMVGLVAQGQVAIHAAFRAGFVTGSVAGGPDEHATWRAQEAAAKRGDTDPLLQLVK